MKTACELQPFQRQGSALGSQPQLPFSSLVVVLLLLSLLLLLEMKSLCVREGQWPIKFGIHRPFHTTCAVTKSHFLHSALYFPLSVCCQSFILALGFLFFAYSPKQGVKSENKEREKRQEKRRHFGKGIVSPTAAMALSECITTYALTKICADLCFFLPPRLSHFALD